MDPFSENADAWLSTDAMNEFFTMPPPPPPPEKAVKKAVKKKPQKVKASVKPTQIIKKKPFGKPTYTKSVQQKVFLKIL